MSTTEGVNPEPYIILPHWLSGEDRRALGAMSVSATWEPGRQGSGYMKSDLLLRRAARPLIDRALNVIGTPDEYDAWLLRYPVDSEIPPHTDTASPGKCHVRLNAQVTNAGGGALSLEGTEIDLQVGDAYVFRPDKTRHSVSRILKGERLIFSVGANIECEQLSALGLAKLQLSSRK